jgi:(4S)-4-hydroxy-5-phosphonooxypentane-2,3-dione isomerase
VYAIFVTAKIKPELRERFLGAIEDDAISSVRDEPGCARFEVLQDRTDPDTYFFYEVYQDQAAFEAHKRTVHFARWSAAAQDVLREPATRIDLTPVFSREFD